MLSRLGVVGVVVGLVGACVLGCESEPAEQVKAEAPVAAPPAKVAEPAVPTELPKPAPAPVPSPAPVQDEPTTPTTFKAADLAGHGGFCPEICRRTRELRCRNAFRCDDMCKNAFADMPCPHLLTPAMECALGQPLTSWICSVDGVGAVMDGPCDAEQTAYDACLTQLK